MPDINEISDEPGKVWKITGSNSLASPGPSPEDAERAKADELFTKAQADLDDANERYRQAAVDSMDAAFRALVFGSRAVGVETVRLDPSDQGDYMTTTHFLDASGEDHPDADALDEQFWQFASDLTDYPDAPWRILAGVEVAENGTSVSIEIRQAALGLLRNEA